MPHQYTRTDQVQFLTEWFDSWSDLQKDDFIPVMSQVLKPKDHLNGLVGGVSSLRVGTRGPSLFDCQVKLFQDWYENWTPAEKQRLMDHFTESDSEFVSKLEKYQSSASNSHEQNAEETLLSTRDEVASSSPFSNDDGLVHESHSSSPLSSLSQPLSPHDSGLEENHSDSEPLPNSSINTEDSIHNLGSESPANQACSLTASEPESEVTRI